MWKKVVTAKMESIRKTERQEEIARGQFIKDLTSVRCSMIETFFWLELISALLVINYLTLIVPLKNSRPGYAYLPEYKTPAFKVLGLTIFTLVLHYFALVFIIELGAVDDWDTSQGVFYTLVQMPGQLWRGSLLLLTLVFLLAYLMPPLLLEKRGIKPSFDVLPMQTKVMIHRSQFILHYIWFLALWTAHSFLGLSNPIALVAILMVLKSAAEAFLFFRVRDGFGG